MQNKFFSTLLLVSGILVALGGVGHSFGGVGPVYAAVDNSAIPASIARLIYVVWHFAGACMGVLGLLAIQKWFELRRHGSISLCVPRIVSVFYLVYGVIALVYMKEPFWTVFLVFGGLLGLATLKLPERA